MSCNTTVSRGSTIIDHPDLDKNYFWQHRQEVCYYAKLNGRSAEDESLKWVSSWVWCSSTDPDELRDQNATLAKYVAMLHQWLMILSNTPQYVRDKWEAECKSSLV